MASVFKILRIGKIALRIIIAGSRRGHTPCSQRDRSVSKGIFEVVGNRLYHKVARNVSETLPEVLSPLVKHRRDLQGIISPFAVKTAHPLDNRIGYRRNSGVTDHTVGFAGVQMPHRQLALLLTDIHHRRDEFSIPLTAYYRV